jgi:hypothetical protein
MTTIDDKPVRPPRVWPGMSTRRSKIFELFVGFFPIWLTLLGVVFVFLMFLIQSCRNAALDRAAQASPLTIHDTE